MQLSHKRIIIKMWLIILLMLILVTTYELLPYSYIVSAIETSLYEIETTFSEYSPAYNHMANYQDLVIFSFLHIIYFNLRFFDLFEREGCFLKIVAFLHCEFYIYLQLNYMFVMFFYQILLTAIKVCLFFLPFLVIILSPAMLNPLTLIFYSVLPFFGLSGFSLYNDDGTFILFDKYEDIVFFMFELYCGLFIIFMSGAVIVYIFYYIIYKPLDCDQNVIMLTNKTICLVTILNFMILNGRYGNVSCLYFLYLITEYFFIGRSIELLEEW